MELDELVHREGANPSTRKLLRAPDALSSPRTIATFCHQTSEGPFSAVSKKMFYNQNSKLLKELLYTCIHMYSFYAQIEKSTQIEKSKESLHYYFMFLTCQPFPFNSAGGRARVRGPSCG